MCKRTKLTHLIFADDLMIFCKAHEKSITRVMEVLNHFPDATGLVANNDKSSFYCAGVNDETKKKFIRLTGFLTGTLPITYLGLPLSSKEWSKVDCHVLVEKIINRRFLMGMLNQRLNMLAGDEKCNLCVDDQVETQQQLFVDCTWTRGVQQALARWSGISFRRQTVKQTLQWLKRRNWKKFHKEVATAIFGALIYHTWKARNWKIFRNLK
ncbi:hypothetical protein MTR67_030576 [Solanum verrucosum]|uniref:Reverse transcriptase domain-containing protein n=1 Tax=Solanum verrucosum TaxID=315347 RepID=A0AAF0TY76_SOLVR|nr:hypothetical protein MTR67_030576 [Solanum verrucosum]